MDPTESLLLLVVVPIIAWVASVLVLRGRYQEVQRDWMSRGQTPPFPRLVIAIAYGAFPVLLGFLMWVMASPLSEALRGLPGQGAADADNLLLWTTVAYSVAACCAIAGQTVIVRSRLSSYLGTDFGRVLPVSVIPVTDAIFALVLGFLSFGYVDVATTGGIPASSAAVASAVSALQAYAVASVAIPVAAAASNRVRDLSARGFTRALMIAELGELPILLGLVMGFLAMAGL